MGFFIDMATFYLKPWFVEQVIIAGDHCAICQEKMHAPILLSCKHLFCEDCVSEWYFGIYIFSCNQFFWRGWCFALRFFCSCCRFDREKTCPLCRAVVKPTEFQSFNDGSTSLLYQVFWLMVLLCSCTIHAWKKIQRACLKRSQNQ